ncbi:MAG: 30S ribosomal protein S16 [Polyangiales bacterium]
MVTVRLSRFGSKKRPYYHIVVADKARARDSRFIEQIGTYDPSAPITSAKVNYDRLNYWTDNGAQLSERVSKVVKEHRAATQSA